MNYQTVIHHLNCQIANDSVRPTHLIRKLVSKNHKQLVHIARVSRINFFILDATEVVEDGPDRE